MLVNDCQPGGKARSSRHCTWNRSFVGANQVSRKPFVPPKLVETMLEMTNGPTLFVGPGGGGALVETVMLNVLVAVFGDGRTLSFTMTRILLKDKPPCAIVGV